MKILAITILIIMFVVGCSSDTADNGPKATQKRKAKQTAHHGEYVTVQQLPGFKNSIGMEFRHLKNGSFTMGSEGKSRKVSLNRPFGISINEVTQEQYEKVMGANPSWIKGRRNPVESVSWNDAVEFCKKLSQLPEERAAGHIYRLPTSAEWEYACRAGTTTKFCFGDDESQLGEYGWFMDNSSETHHPVGQKRPNAWGLFDMHGNVSEWCQGSKGRYQDYRGGCWNRYANSCYSSQKNGFLVIRHNSVLGFRVASGAVNELSEQ